MNAETYAEWLRCQGYRVVRTPSGYWYEASPRVYHAFPYHRLIEPPDKEVVGLLREHRALGLRYSAPVTASHGKVSYHVVCERPYDLESLSQRAHQDARQGLQHVSIEPISFSRLATEGWQLRVETLERHGQGNAECLDWWCRLCLSAADLPDFEAWGAMKDGQLVASSLAYAWDDCYVLSYQQSATSYLPYGVNNAIFFAVAHKALQRPGISKVLCGLQSLNGPWSVDEFKFHMGCTARPVRQQVVVHPWLAPFANRTSHAVVKRMLSRDPGNLTLARAEGMLRFYLEGKRPVTRQDWPDGLIHHKRELLESIQ